MGYKRKTTPTLDKMAKDGLYFENAIAHSVPTAPSIFGILTGEYPLIDSTIKGDWRSEIARNTVLPQKLRELGYTCIAFQTNPWLSRYFGFNKGFDYYIELTSERDAINLKYYKGGSLLLKVLKWTKNEWFYINWNKFYSSFIGELSKIRKPYFAWIHLLEPHFPYVIPRKFKKWSKNNLYINFLHWKLGRRKILKPNEQKELINAYDDCIRYADFFLEKLKSDLEADEPILIISSDHGEEFWEHGSYGHEVENVHDVLYETIIHVPLVIYNTGVRGKIREPISLLKLHDIILDLAYDKFSSILNKTEKFVISKVFESGKRRISVRSWKWKYIMGQRQIEELYDLEKDPYEQENLIRDYPKLAKELKAIVRNHIRREIELRKIRDICDKFRRRKKL